MTPDQFQSAYANRVFHDFATAEFEAEKCNCIGIEGGWKVRVSDCPERKAFRLELCSTGVTECDSGMDIKS